VAIRGSYQTGLFHLGRALFSQQKYGEALSHLDRSIQLWDTAYPGVGSRRSPPQFPDTLDLRAATLLKLGRATDTENSRKRAMDIRREQEKAKPPKSESAMVRLPPDCYHSKPPVFLPDESSALLDLQLTP
jgi:tetratricopeptide (TPR) repeat protein